MWCWERKDKNWEIQAQNHRYGETHKSTLHWWTPTYFYIFFSISLHLHVFHWFFLSRAIHKQRLFHVTLYFFSAIESKVSFKYLMTFNPKDVVYGWPHYNYASFFFSFVFVFFWISTTNLKKTKNTYTKPSLCLPACYRSEIAVIQF